MGAQRCLLIARRRGSARFNLGLTNSLGAVHLFCAEVVIVKLESSPNTKSVVCTITHLFPHFNTRCRKRKGNALYCVVTCCRVVLPCIVLIMLEIIPESLSEWKDQPFATQAFKTWNFRCRGRFCCENNLKLGKDGQILFHLLTKLFTTAVKF